MNKINSFCKATFLLILLTLTGCASVQKPVSIDTEKLNSSDAKIAILVSPIPKAFAHRQGAEGLLDIAINSAVTSGVGKYLATVEAKPLLTLSSDLELLLKDKNIEVKILEDYKLPELSDFEKKPKEGNFTKKDFSPLKDELDVDQLLLLDINQIGTIRNYYGFIPLNAPKAIFSGTGKLVDLSTNELLWFKPVYVETPIEGKWDQPKEGYPNLTDALMKNMNTGKEKLLVPFKN